MDITFDSTLSTPSTPSRSVPSPAPFEPIAVTRRARIAGRIISALPVLFLTFDVCIKLTDLPMVREASVQLGLPSSITLGVALLLAACLALYVVPRTAVIGAVLLTGYLGGAVLVHLRVDSPWFSHTLFPVYVGAMLWLGLFLRDARVRRLLSSA
jgi:hypothetical protein